MEIKTDSLENLPQVSESADMVIIEELFTEATRRYQRNDFSGAVLLYENIISTNPELIEAYINLGDAYFKANKIEEAVNYWEKALSMDSSQINCYINIGNAYYFNNKIIEAITQWQIALTMAPNHPKVLLNIGAAYEKLGEKSSSFKYYEKFLAYSSLNRNEDFYLIQNKVKKSKELAVKCLTSGVKFQKRNNLRIAAKYYLKSIDVYPNFSKSHLNLGSICYIANKYEHAIKYWLESVKVDPSYNNTYRNLGIAYEMLKQYSYAYCMYKRFLDPSFAESQDSMTVRERLDKIKDNILKEDIQKHIENGDKFFKAQKYYDALFEYENFILLKPDQKSVVEDKINKTKNILNPEKHVSIVAYEVGMACFKQQKYDNAIQALRRYLFFEPDGEFSTIAAHKIKECDKLLRGLS